MQHGKRSTYVRGCRCDACRAANRAYELGRRYAVPRRDGKGFVSAVRAQAHLLALAEVSVGVRAVMLATGINYSRIMDIKLGRVERIRAATEARILGVTAAMALDRALIDAAPSWAQIKSLTDKGVDLKAIAGALGVKRLNTSLAQITVRRADQIRQVCARLSADAELACRLREETDRRRQRSLKAAATVAHAPAAAAGVPFPDLIRLFM